MKNRAKNYLNNKKGMSLVEVLTAMALISLAIFCFAPLFLTYLDSIVIAGDEIVEINEQSGIMQTVIGLDKNAGNYSTDVGNIPLSLKADQGTTLSRKGKTGSIANTATASLGRDLDNFQGDLLFSDDTNLNNSYITVAGDSQGSGLSYYPSSITDDFHEATITLVTDGGLTFGDKEGKGFSSSDIKISVSNAGALTEKEDYTVRWITNEVVLITFYGGGKVCFENSPATIKYSGYTCIIEIDAPMMMMVGEKTTRLGADGTPVKDVGGNQLYDYFYYVSRGELDDNGNLLIHRRTMNGAPLTSAMNDVEWVSAENADAYAVDGGKKYGYYVMCGDEGQIRRFWKNSNTGNYYWGGDYTYHTDINIDTSNTSEAAKVRYNTEWKKELDTDFTYVYRGSHISSGAGVTNCVGGYSYVRLFNSILFSVNALDTDKRDSNTNIEVYIPDGEVYYFETGKEEGKDSRNYGDLENHVSTRAAMNSIFYADGDYNNAVIGGVGHEGLDRYWNINLATDWIGLRDNSTYYAVKGQAQNANMITLTCVDAINMSNLSASAKEAGGPYYTVAADGSNYNSGSLDYPTANYNLYCGYIPAVMDLWANSHSRGNDNSIGRKNDWKKYNFYQVGNSWLRNKNDHYTADSVFRIGSNDRDGNAGASDFWLWPYWKGTYGLVPYADHDGNTIKYGGLQRAMEYTAEVHNSDFLKWYEFWNFDIAYYPFENIGYAPLGKAFDSKTPIDSSIVGPFTGIIPSDVSRLVVPQIYINGGDGFNQQNVTGGQPIDITLTYLSHPLAISAAMNPTDDMVYDMSNNKSGNRVFYWNNTRDAATYLDCASAMIPSGENDIPVSLLVGYITGGLAEYTGGNAGDNDANAFVNSIFTNGIVLLRAGKGDSVGAGSANFDTGEERAMDNGGYKLTNTSNAFHQFYYLNSRTNESEKPERNHITKGDSIGDVHGAYFWQNNRHIAYVSVNGEQSAMATGSFNSDSYEYLRCHPLTNTKVTCVTWGTSWAGNPVAMWGTENGTLLSWKCEINDDNGDGETVTSCSGAAGFFGLFSKGHSSDSHSEYHNDRSVVAEFQSYQWIDSVNKKANFKITSDQWLDSVGSAKPNSKSAQQYTFDEAFTTEGLFGCYEDFYDACSRIAQSTGKVSVKDIGFVSTLENINDAEYANDVWIACGDQSDVNPKTYCGKNYKKVGDAGKGTAFVARPYITADNYNKEANPNISGNGTSKGSWINVNYWIDIAATGKQSSDNRYYQWSAVQISTETDCNIVQINNLNGMWIATGYKDNNGNDEYDDGEPARIFWTYDPRIPCGVNGGWSDDVLLYDGKELVKGQLSAMGGINSCATRTVD